MPGRILVVDDVATNRIILKAKLSGACYDVLQAGNGIEALRIAREQAPDLILLDIAMPELDGLETCRRLKADPRTAGIPVVMVTSSANMATKLAALEAGAEDFMTKPVDEMALLARVRSLLRARSIDAELSLRDGTCEALGFSDAPSCFVAAGRVCLVAGNRPTALAWERMLSEVIRDRIEICSPSKALASSSAERVPDVFLIAADLEHEGDGLMLLSELRSRPQTRHAAILVVVEPEARRSATMALDLGASDIISLPLDGRELAIRLRTQLERKRQADRLRRQVRDGLQMAVTDPLTGLYNRRYAMSHLARVHERAQDSARGYALLLIDLDNFKRVNDTHGHAAGDTVLQSVARLLTANLRSVDLVARIGGEEFLAILPNITPAAAENAAERLRGAIAATAISIPPGLISDVADLHQTVSIGLVAVDANQMDAMPDTGGILAAADQALYRSKALGRNLVTRGEQSRAAA
ncbi:diguanylate cyclase [Tropicimonas sp. IMCC34043]|uniref:diguanylate cyclase n=1 Tax=Tropicimonas sp. IMCC34043 TaxID=2248760 RepID=UPI000E22E603|nr:diguanylate cyclase [Tropicimonas sp. IMCC34043]